MFTYKATPQERVAMLSFLDELVENPSKFLGLDRSDETSATEMDRWRSQTEKNKFSIKLHYSGSREERAETIAFLDTLMSSFSEFPDVNKSDEKNVTESDSHVETEWISQTEKNKSLIALHYSGSRSAFSIFKKKSRQPMKTEDIGTLGQDHSPSSLFEGL